MIIPLIYPNLDLNEVIMIIHKTMEKNKNKRIVMFHIESKKLKKENINEDNGFNNGFDAFADYYIVYTLIIVISNFILTQRDFNDMIRDLKRN